MRPDGSWPIDTNLATWVTTLSVNALAACPTQQHPLDAERKRAIRDWLLAQQYREEHPYTHAAPGGWAWTPLPGGVPDADDTAGALLALRNLGDRSMTKSGLPRSKESAGCSTCRTATAACRRSAAAGASCRSTAAAPT